MFIITVDVPREIAAELPQTGNMLGDLLVVASEHLPTALELRLRHAPLPLDIYRTILGVLAQKPSSEEIAALTLPGEANFRLMRLREKADAGALSPTEREELDELEHIELLIGIFKAHWVSNGN